MEISLPEDAIGLVPKGKPDRSFGIEVGRGLGNIWRRQVSGTVSV